MYIVPIYNVHNCVFGSVVGCVCVLQKCIYFGDVLSVLTSFKGARPT